MSISPTQVLACIGALMIYYPPTPESNNAAQILLIDGTGTSPNDVKAIEAVLKGMHLNYATADSRHVNRMSVSELMAYRLMIIPGGNYLAMGNSLAPGTTTN